MTTHFHFFFRINKVYKLVSISKPLIRFRKKIIGKKIFSGSRTESNIQAGGMFSIVFDIF